MSCNVLCIDDDPEFLAFIRLSLSKSYNCYAAVNLKEGLEIIHRETIDLVLLDINLPDADNLEGLRHIKKADANADIVIVTGNKDPKFMVSAVRAGAADYLSKPFEIEELIAVIEKLLRSQDVKVKHNALLEDVRGISVSSRLLGQSPSICNLLNTASRLRGHNANILIEGESGTGKELVARFLHCQERDIKRPFVAVNCAGIPDTLMESELFGYEKGAFTGAVARKIGKFELANDGDIFLDEISTLKPELQAKLLRVLQEKEVTRVGGNSVIRINFRVIAATNRNLEKMVEEGLFRADLYHRLVVIHLKVPPLRERTEDIPFLARHFLEKYGKGKTDQTKELSSGAISLLKEYSWPGNVRELENLMHNLTVMMPDKIIEEDDLVELTNNNPYKYGKKVEEDGSISNLALDEYVDTVERDYIKRVIRISRGNKSEAAKKLKIGRSTFYNRCRELGILLERE